MSVNGILLPVKTFQHKANAYKSDTMADCITCTCENFIDWYNKTLCWSNYTKKDTKTTNFCIFDVYMLIIWNDFNLFAMGFT